MMSLLRSKPAEQAVTPRQPKGPVREWFGAMLFAVVAATLLRWTTVQAYHIPTPSMESSLLVGDYLFVSKLHYGPITPQTPLQMPLTHQTFWGTNLNSYSDLIQLPRYRFPGFSQVRRNDVVVFHVPHEQHRPADQRTHLIKRCVAVAGDTVALVNGQVVVNGAFAQPAGRLQRTYFMEVAAPDDAVRQALQQQGIADYNEPDGLPRAVIHPKTGKTGFLISCPAEVAAYFRPQPYVQSLTDASGLFSTGPLFPDAADFHVSTATSAVPRHAQLDAYGPLPVPQKGQVVKLTSVNAAVYYKIVAQYEHNSGITWQNGMIYQNGQPLTSYTIKQNYYFMLGDNRHNSEDSRFWGFVPEDHIVGKAVFVWLSLDPYADWLHKIRWNRLFRPIS